MEQLVVVRVFDVVEEVLYTVADLHEVQQRGHVVVGSAATDTDYA